MKNIIALLFCLTMTQFAVAEAESTKIESNPSLITDLATMNPDAFYIETPFSAKKSSYENWELGLGRIEIRDSGNSSGVYSPNVGETQSVGTALTAQYNTSRTVGINLILGATRVGGQFLGTSVDATQWALGANLKLLKFHIAGSHAFDLGLSAGLAGDTYMNIVYEYIGTRLNIPLSSELALLGELRSAPGRSDSLVAMTYHLN